MLGDEVGGVLASHRDAHQAVGDAGREAVAGGEGLVQKGLLALAMLMPVDIQAAAKAKRSPSLTLMPLSFASILGGMITLIGTPPNLLVAEGLHWPSLSPGGGANQLTSQRLTDQGETCAFHCSLVEVELLSIGK